MARSCVFIARSGPEKSRAKPKKKPGKPVAIVSTTKKPGYQAIATTAPDLPPVPGPTRHSRAIMSTAPRHAQPVGRD